MIRQSIATSLSHYRIIAIVLSRHRAIGSFCHHTIVITLSRHRIIISSSSLHCYRYVIWPYSDSIRDHLHNVSSLRDWVQIKTKGMTEKLDNILRNSALLRCVIQSNVIRPKHVFIDEDLFLVWPFEKYMTILYNEFYISTRQLLQEQ